MLLKDFNILKTFLHLSSSPMNNVDDEDKDENQVDMSEHFFVFLEHNQFLQKFFENFFEHRVDKTSKNINFFLIFFFNFNPKI